jgi:hypothetical protein
MALEKELAQVPEQLVDRACLFSQYLRRSVWKKNGCVFSEKTVVVVVLLGSRVFSTLT